MEGKFQPKLRFAEFKEDWVESKIKDIAPLQRGFDLPSTELVDGIYPVVYSNGIQNYHLEYKAIGPGIVTGRSGTIGKVHFVEGKYWPHNTSLWVTNFFKNNQKFIYYFYIKLDLTKYNAGSTVPTLNRNDVHDLKRSIPSLPEQQKIAEYLSSIDQKISLLIEKKKELSRYKKAMMQQLFSQQIRFKDENGNEFDDWEEKRLGEVSDKPKYGLNSSAKSYDGINGYLRITDIDESSNRFINTGVTSPDKFSEEFLLRKGDLLFTRTGASTGKTYLYSESDGKLFFAGFLIKFSIKKESDPRFIFYQTKSTNYKKWIRIMSMRSGQPGVNSEEYSNFIFFAPCLKEQQKIANFLSAIDESIDKVNEQIKQTQGFKKAMLQQMFV